MGKADYYKSGSWNTICDSCGFKYKIEDMQQRWDGYWVCREKCFEIRQPQDYVKGVMDKQSVEVDRPDPPEEFTSTAQSLQIWGSEALPVASFSGTPLSGSSPLSVLFTNTTTGTVSNYLWSFGDSETSTETNPTHEYINAGTYTVSLTATNSAGSDSETKVDYITVTGAGPENNIISLTSTGTPTPFSLIAAGADANNAYAILFEAAQVTWSISEAGVEVFSNVIATSGGGNFQITGDGVTARLYKDSVEIDSTTYIDVGPYSQQSLFEGSPNTLTNIVIN